MSDLFMAHIDRRKISVCFYTIVARNQAIAEKYPGGMPVFVSKHRVICNRDIAVCCFMAIDELDATYRDMEDNGLTRPADFAFFDAARVTLGMEEDQRIPSQVPWMRCAYQGRRITVWYEDGPKRDDQVIQERLLGVGIDPEAMDPERYRALQGRLMAMAGEIGLEAALERIGQELPAAE
jgi:hypothetical protein